jgi:enolase
MKLVITKLFSLLLIAMALTSHLTHAESKKIIKWVDANGVTHYGDKPPMPDVNARQSSVLNKQGITIDQMNNKIEKEATVAEEGGVSTDQKRYDQALLATYATVEEIELARKRNVRIDELTLEELKQRRRNMQTESAEQFDKAALQKMEQRIRDQQKIIANINKRYESDKKRFTELKASMHRLKNN